MTVRALSLSACLLASLTGINLPAGQISPGFSAAGDMTVIQRAIDSADVNSLLTALPAMIGGDSDGWFSSLDAATTTIDGWNRSTESVGSDFDPAVFIYFDAEATMPTLGNIVGGADPASACSASLSAVVRAAADPGAAWRGTPALPETPSDSPFSFGDNPWNTGALPIQTTATCSLARTTTGGGNREGNFSARFARPFQTVVSDFPADGSITKTFAATIIVTTKVDPDGGYMLGSGLGLIFLALGSRRLFGKRQAKLDWGGREERPPTSRGLRAIIGLPDESARIRFS